MIKTKFAINPSQKGQQFMRMCGVPAGLLAPCSVDLRKLIAPFNLKENQLITVDQQLSWFSKLKSEFGPYLAVISSQQYYQQARSIATLIIWSHLTYWLNGGSKRGQVPTWENPTSEFRNILLEEFRDGQHSDPTLLVIDNVYADIPNGKLDKIRDLLQIMCDRPRIVIYNGAEPYKFAVERLGLKPTNIINVAKSTIRKIV